MRGFIQIGCDRTLLAFAEQPAMTWQTHYYVQRHLMSCSRQQVLAFMVRSLFGGDPPYPPKVLVKALDRDLSEAPSHYSLIHIVDLPFFHYVHPKQVAEQVFQFWQSEAFVADRCMPQKSQSDPSQPLLL